MTTDELKESLPMRQVVESYGVKVRKDGMCCCPIHGERHPSMKIYKDSYNCFACGTNGDIFSFVMAMDNCDFKTAFYSLGGTYEKTTDRQKLVAQYKRNSAKVKRETVSIRTEDLKNIMIASLDRVQKSVNEDVPFSDRWCLSQNMYPVLSNWWEQWNYGEELEILDVYRRCKQFIERFDTL